jgi:hypothetical protein
MPSSRTIAANGIDIFLLEEDKGQERADEVNAALIGFLKQNAG